MVRDRQRMGEGGKILIASGVDSRLEACKYLSPHDHRGAATVSTALFSSPRVNPPKLRNLRNIYITSLPPTSSECPVERLGHASHLLTQTNPPGRLGTGANINDFTIIWGSTCEDAARL